MQVITVETENGETLLSAYSQEAPPVVPGNGVDARGLGGDGVDGLEPRQVVECNPLGE
jgi:hypothetical protein